MYAGTWKAILEMKTGERVILLVAIATIFTIGYIFDKTLGNPIDFFPDYRGWILAALLLFAVIPIAAMFRNASKIDAQKIQLQPASSHKSNIEYNDDNNKQPTSPYRIVSLELAKDENGAKKVINGWREWKKGDLTPTAKKDIKIDFIFILAYVALLSFTSFWIADLYTNKIPWITQLGLITGWIVPIAGILDIIENFAMLRMLKSGVGQLLAQIAFWTALPKFVILLYIAIPFAFGFGLVSLFQTLFFLPNKT